MENNYYVRRPVVCESSNMLDCSNTTDLTNGKGEVRNYYCTQCKRHNYKGKQYTAEEWNKWIEDHDYSLKNK